jgi:ABC-type microcin C transport system permease subunit YejB
MLAQILHEFQTKEIERIGKLIAAGLDSADILKNPQRLFGFYRQARLRYLEMLTRVGNFGRGQVNAELKRQGA